MCGSDFEAFLLPLHGLLKIALFGISGGERP
jgi:hypothetical protein